MLGQKLSHYQIVGKLGEGGMGVVYRARDLRLGRFVAIKVLAASAVGDSGRRRFLQEARAASALDHPGIVTVYHVDEREGLDFIVMELVEGRPLSESIRPPGLPVDFAIDVATQIANAMAAAHSAGIVHRDLKPQNLILTEEGRVKVLDFGVARLKAIAGQDGESTLIADPLTAEGAAIGTLSYMSPEQALGEAVDRRSDVFSLGVVLYEMLTGHRPFEGAHAAALLHAIHYRDPEPPRRRRPEVSEALEALVTRTLAKDPLERPPGMEEVEGELNALRDERESPSAERRVAGGRREVARPPGSRWGKWAAVAGGVFLALAAIVSQPGGSASGVTTPWSSSASEVDSWDVYLMVQRGRFLLERYDQEERLTAAIDLLERAVGRFPDSAPAHAVLARALWARYHADNKDRIWLDRAAIHAARAVELDEHLAVGHTSLALVEVELGESERALDRLERARILDPNQFEVPLAAGLAHQATGALREAEAAFRLAVELGGNRREPHDYLGSVLVRQGRYREAEESFRRSTRLAPDCYISHRNLAGVYQRQGRFEDAASALQTSLEIRPSWSGYSNLGTLHFFLGRFEQSVGAFERALELGANDYRVWGNLADGYRWASGRRAQAGTAYRRAIQLARERAVESPENGTLRSRLATFLAKQGDCESAVAEIETLEPLPAEDVNLQVRAIQVYEICGYRAKALQSLREALAGGLSIEEVRRDPELTELRRDVGYHLLLADSAEAAS